MPFKPIPHTKGFSSCRIRFLQIAKFEETKKRVPRTISYVLFISFPRERVLRLAKEKEEKNLGARARSMHSS